MSIISSILNHGRILQDSGSSLVLLSELSHYVDEISVISWKSTVKTKEDPFNSIKLYQVFDQDHPFSILGYFKTLRRLNSQVYIFNLMPTAYGNSNIANFFGLIIPLYAKWILRKNTVVIYHNSTYTNNPVKLGYTGLLNSVRVSFLKKIEKSIFTTVDTYFFTETYRQVLLSIFPDAKVHAIHLPFFQVLGTLYLNGVEGEERISVTSGQKPRILLFGSWGPQKNPKEALEGLRKLKNEGSIFSLTVAGGINEHFPALNESYDRMFDEFKDVVEKRLQYVPEEKLIDLFTNTDFVVIPYNTPGGFSSVLALSIFFERYVIITDFPEYREQAKSYRNISFYEEGDLYNKMKALITSAFLPNNSVDVIIKERIDAMVMEFSKLIEMCLRISSMEPSNTQSKST